MPAPSLSAYLLVAAVAAVVTFVATPLVRRLSVRLGAVAPPDERHVHTVATPRGGGAAMLVGVVGAFCVAAFMDDFADVMSARTEMLGVVVAAAVIWSVGFVDDVREISAPAKVAGMVLAGGVLSMTGVSILVFRVPFFDLLFLSADWSALVTVLWVLGMATAVNLIDGLDGLAGGTVAIASGTFLLYALRLSDADVIGPNNPGALWACITLGVCVGFLPHNVHPARIFMGDGGALLLGLLMAVSTMSVGGRTTQEFSGQAFFLLRADFHSAGHPRGTDSRHSLRYCAPSGAWRCGSCGGQGTPSPPAHADRSWPWASRAHFVDVDGLAIGLCAVSDVHRKGRRRRADRNRGFCAGSLHGAASTLATGCY